MIWALLEVLAPVVLTAGLGFTWTRVGAGFDTDMVTRLVLWLGAPCLIFESLTRYDLPLLLLAEQAAAAIAVCALVGATAWALAWSAGWPLASFVPPVLFPNAGNLGLPLALFAFGDEALGLAVPYFAVTSMLQHTLGQRIAAGKGRGWRALLTPNVFAIGAAVLVVASDVTVPRFLGNTIALVGDLTIPLMLLALGVSLGSLQVRRLGTSLRIAVLRLVLGLAAGLAVAWLFGLEGTARSVLILLSAMPVAVFTYLFAARYGRDSDLVAGAVVLSTLISFATLPLLLWYLLP
ncbi:AEC family transporter [Marinibaculum pumilum]|uniref:AEC family transporter n=1 Tax=Marinibaculum pumilum TaxID=1766165 RepID=A0ABV7KXW6_9PROT